MLSKVFRTQWRNSNCYDWTEQIREDLKTFGMEVSSMSKFKFKSLIKSKSREVAFNQLMNRKSKHSKLENLVYYDLTMQSYLKKSDISVRQGQYLFRSRTTMTRYWINFKGGSLDTNCPVCRLADEPDTQEHSFKCVVIKQSGSLQIYLTM